MAKLAPADRGPLIIAGGIVLAGFFVAVALYMARATDAPSAAPTPFDPRASAEPATPTPSIDPTIADTEATDGLREVATAATAIGIEEGSLAAANTLALSKAVPEFTYMPSSRPSSRPNEISIMADGLAWSAATQSESGTCFWIKIRLAPSGTEAIPSYGAGTPCTGQGAQVASGTEFPAD